MRHKDSRPPCRGVYLCEPLACLRELHPPRRPRGPYEVLAECEIIWSFFAKQQVS